MPLDFRVLGNFFEMNGFDLRTRNFSSFFHSNGVTWVTSFIGSTTSKLPTWIEKTTHKFGGKFAEIGWRSHWPSFFLRHRGFERVSTGCRAPDRVGPKSGLPWFTKAHFFGYFFHIFLAPLRCRIPLFKLRVTHKNLDSSLIYRIDR